MLWLSACNTSCNMPGLPVSGWELSREAAPRGRLAERRANQNPSARVTRSPEISAMPGGAAARIVPQQGGPPPRPDTGVIRRHERVEAVTWAAVGPGEGHGTPRPRGTVK